MLNYIIKERDILEINKLYSDGVLKNNNLLSCYASIDYYNSAELSVCSVFRSLCKNHYFTDGNKRTACDCLYILCYFNDIPFELTNKELEEITLDVANNRYSVELICKKIFKK